MSNQIRTIRWLSKSFLELHAGETPQISFTRRCGLLPVRVALNIDLLAALAGDVDL